VSWTFKSVAVVGAGAVGLYYGARLAANGVEVRFLLRSDYAAVKADGIRIESVAGDVHLENVAAFQSPEEIGPVDLVIVAWKSTSNHLFKSVIPLLLHETTQILTLQNGLGNCERLAELFGAERVLGGLCFVCLNRLSPGLVSHTAGGRIAVGEFAPDQRGRAQEVARRFSAAKIPCEAEVDLAAAQWKKLIWNVPFNGLAIAEGGVTTDVLLASPEIEQEIRALMEEVVAAANRQGLAVDAKLIDWNIDRTRPMGPYRPSSMIDYVEGREVEFEAIWQEPLRRAKAVGLEVPHLESLAKRIQEKIRSRNP
jgi:2-dehydropantoate 2-reductase